MLSNWELEIRETIDNPTGQSKWESTRTLWFTHRIGNVKEEQFPAVIWLEVAESWMRSCELFNVYLTGPSDPNADGEGGRWWCAAKSFRVGLHYFYLYPQHRTKGGRWPATIPRAGLAHFLGIMDTSQLGKAKCTPWARNRGAKSL